MFEGELRWWIGHLVFIAMVVRKQMYLNFLWIGVGGEESKGFSSDWCRIKQVIYKIRWVSTNLYSPSHPQPIKPFPALRSTSVDSLQRLDSRLEWLVILLPRKHITSIKSYCNHQTFMFTKIHI